MRRRREVTRRRLKPKSCCPLSHKILAAWLEYDASCRCVRTSDAVPHLLAESAFPPDVLHVPGHESLSFDHGASSTLKIQESLSEPILVGVQLADRAFKRVRLACLKGSETCYLGYLGLFCPRTCPADASHAVIAFDDSS